MMPQVDMSRLHVVTGGPGSGKSALIAALAAAGTATSEEVGRRIIREQMASGGRALPWDDAMAFADAMMIGEVAAHRHMLSLGRPVVLDRGVPDVIGFLTVVGLPVPDTYRLVAEHHRYNPRVFIAPFWDQIYCADAERRQSPATAAATEMVMRDTYQALGYTLIDLPRASVAERVAFVRAELDQPGFIPP